MSDHDYIKKLETMFKEEGFKVYYVELYADKDMRLERNKSENRLQHKPSKRNISESEARFIRLEEKYRLNSYEGEIKKENYIKMDNTHLTPLEVALMIKDTFNL